MQRVSIIVPVYNVKDYLEKCVNSITNQTEHDIQIILIDDGSTDGSALLCDKLAEHDNRIVVIHKENGGLSSARNCGLRKASGEFVCFVDSDDIISPYYVEHLLSLIEKNECDISVGEYICFNEDEPIFEIGDCVVELMDGHEAINKLFGDSYVTATIAWNKMYKKTLFNDVQYPEGLINEDEAVAYKLYYKASKVAFTNEVIYGYYMRENSITKSKFSKRNYDFLKIAWERCLFFEQKKEERYYHLFLKIYCWALLDHAKKTKTIIGNREKSKELIDEFKKKSSILLKSSHISVIKKTAIASFRAFPILFYVYQRIKNKER